MIDRIARDKVLKTIDLINKGVTTTWEADDLWMDVKWTSEDMAPKCIMLWMWLLFDDDLNVPMLKILNEEQLKIVERCALFLTTDLEMEVPKLSADEYKKRKKWWGKNCAECYLPMIEEGNEDVWPFSKDQYRRL